MFFLITVNIFETGIGGCIVPVFGHGLDPQTQGCVASPRPKLPHSHLAGSGEGPAGASGRQLRLHILSVFWLLCEAQVIVCTL